MSTARERAEEKRREKLTRIREQIASGELTIRQMTPAERAEHPPRPPRPRRPA
jgi:anti-sigma28 factor (negative regulator of flagellin synthesis)